MLKVFLLLISFLVMSNSNIHYYGNAFKNVKAKWVKRLQGMCHDDNYFYITQMKYIWRIPRTISIEHVKKTNGAEIIKKPIPASLRQLGSDHMGDCDVNNGLVYIALEGTRPQKMLIMKADSLEYVSAPDLSLEQKMAPWVSVDPVTGIIYSGDFNIKKSVLKYQLSDDLSTLTLSGRFEIFNKEGKPMNLSRVQGVDIVSSRGVIWFVSDKEGQGLYGFDFNTGKLMHRTKIAYKTGFPFYQELEGIDTLEAWETPFNLYQGNLFIPMLDQNLFKDQAFLKHYHY